MSILNMLDTLNTLNTLNTLEVRYSRYSRSKILRVRSLNILEFCFVAPIPTSAKYLLPSDIPSGIQSNSAYFGIAAPLSHAGQCSGIDTDAFDSRKSARFLAEFELKSTVTGGAAC